MEQNLAHQLLPDAPLFLAVGPSDHRWLAPVFAPFVGEVLDLRKGKNVGTGAFGTYLQRRKLDDKLSTRPTFLLKNYHQGRRPRG